MRKRQDRIQWCAPQLLRSFRIMSLRSVWGNLIRPVSKGGAKGSALVTHQPSAPFSVFGRHTYSY